MVDRVTVEVRWHKLCDMNTLSPEGLARLLGVSRRRVLAAASRLCVGTRRANGRWSFTADEIEQLRAAIGEHPPVPGLSPTEAQVLAELARRPRGMVSARALARSCGLSPATAAKAVTRLGSCGLVIASQKTVALGRAVRVATLHANRRHPDWPTLVPLLAAVRPPARQPPDRAAPVPYAVKHAFWNVPADRLASLTPASDGRAIAARAITCGDLQLLSYAAGVLAPADWSSAARLRRLDPDQRQLAENLAAAAG
jgi:DNA-binding MarR family transcriptional regulator